MSERLATTSLSSSSSTTALATAPIACSKRSPPWIRASLVIKLRRNFGQTSALAAGFDHAQGEYFVLAMDGDLQHDPLEVPNFHRQARRRVRRRLRLALPARRQLPLCAASRPAPPTSSWPSSPASPSTTSAPPSRPTAARSSRTFPSTARCTASSPRLASWYGASICEIPISNPARVAGKPLRHLPHLSRLLRPPHDPVSC